MADSRIKKYENYRKKINAVDNSTSFEDKKTPKTRIYSHTDTLNTTSALPLDEIVSSLDEISQEELRLKIKKRKTIIKNTFIVAGLILVACAIIITGIFLFQ